MNEQLIEKANIIAEVEDNEERISVIKSLLSEKKTKQEGILKLAQFVLNEFSIITFRDSGEIFVYLDGIYFPDGETVLCEHIQKDLNLGKNITKHTISEFLGYIQRFTYKDRSKILEPKDMICLKNGILNLKTMEVIDHNPEFVFFNKIPVVYDSQANCHRFKQFLSEIVPEDSVQIIQEIFGYLLYKQYFIHKAFMFIGSGRNGKSTLINVIKAFLGAENCSSVALQQLETNRFMLASLFGKLANLFADLSAKALRDTAFFKMLTGQDLIQAEKKFKNSFAFVNYAKMIFSCNQLPKSPDQTDAFFARWIIILFPNQFLGKKDDKMLISKLTTSEELSGILNWAIEGIKRLLEIGEFSTTESIEEIRNNYLKKSNPVEAFVSDCILISPEDYEPKEVLYSEYTEYCRENVCPIVPKNSFFQDIRNCIKVVDYKATVRIGEKSERQTCLRGLKLDREKIKLQNNLDNPDSIDGSVIVVKDVNPNSLLYYQIEDYVKSREVFTKQDLVTQFGEANSDKISWLIETNKKTGVWFEPKAGELRVVK